jgi:hypothetical protein
MRNAPARVHPFGHETHKEDRKVTTTHAPDRFTTLPDARAVAAYGQNSSVGKILEIHQELPGRIHIVLIRQSVGF